jgi:hypothetical protein
MSDPADDKLPAPIPRIDRKHFEDYGTFRETFLAWVTDPVTNTALRNLGEAQYAAFLEYSKYWPAHDEDLVCTFLRSALADLRYLQFYLALEDGDFLTYDPADPEIALARKVSADLGRISDEIERGLKAMEEAEEQEG